MATIQLLNGAEKIKDSYGKINTSVTNLNNSKMEKSGDTMTGNLSIQKEFPSLILDDTSVGGVLASLTGYSGRLSIRLGANSSANEVLGVMTDGLLFSPNGRRIVIGTGSPQGVVAAPAGSIYLNTSGGASTTIWVKESGTGNTGWVAK